MFQDVTHLMSFLAAIVCNLDKRVGVLPSYLGEIPLTNALCQPTSKKFALRTVSGVLEGTFVVGMRKLPGRIMLEIVYKSSVVSFLITITAVCFICVCVLKVAIDIRLCLHTPNVTVYLQPPVNIIILSFTFVVNSFIFPTHCCTIIKCVSNTVTMGQGEVFLIWRWP